MIVFPAIDLKNGECVRLIKGDFSKKTVYNNSPEEVAYQWEMQGAEFLHIVDLDGALAGEPRNLAVIKNILNCVNIPLELGGGIRSIATIEKVLGYGVSRVILGSIAVQNKNMVIEACKVYGEKILVGIDAKDGIAAIDGWGVSSDISAIELAKRLADVGAKTIIYTDISRDGTLTGINIAETVKLAEESGVHIIASGGVSSLDDIKKLKEQEAKGVIGVIIGKALYEGTVSLTEAIEVAR